MKQIGTNIVTLRINIGINLDLKHAKCELNTPCKLSYHRNVKLCDQIIKKSKSFIQGH